MNGPPHIQESGDIYVQPENHAAPQHEAPGFGGNDDDEAWTSLPDTKEGMIGVLQREMAEARTLMTEMEAGS